MHNSKTTWDTNRQTIKDKVNLSIKLIEHEDIELETNSLLSLLQHATKEATPNGDPPTQKKQITYPTKLRNWQPKSFGSELTHQTAEEHITEKNNKLKSKLQVMRNESFEKYVSNLKR